MSRPYATDPVATAVYDTNVLFAAIYGARRGKGTPPVLSWRAVLEGAVAHASSPHILEELHRALTVGSRLLPDLVTAATELVADASRIVEPGSVPAVLERDPDDNHILAAAAAVGSECLVTGNRKHYEELGRRESGLLAYRGVEIISPRGFLDVLRARLPRDHRFRETLDATEGRGG